MGLPRVGCGYPVGRRCSWAEDECEDGGGVFEFAARPIRTRRTNQLVGADSA